jgi:hypothetical protein
MSWDLYGIPGRGGMTCPSILQVPKWRCDLECATELYRRVCTATIIFPGDDD